MLVSHLASQHHQHHHRELLVVLRRTIASSRWRPFITSDRLFPSLRADHIASLEQDSTFHSSIMFTHTNLLLALASLVVVAEAHVRPHARDVQQAAHVIPAAMHRAAALHAHYSHPRRISGVKPRGRAERLAKRSSGAQATVKCLTETTFALCDEYGKCTDMGAVAGGSSRAAVAS